MPEGGNRTSMNLETGSMVFKVVALGLEALEACLAAGTGGVGTVTRTAEQWLWAFCFLAVLLPIARMIGARLMDRPIPKELELAYLILGAYGTHFALGPVVSLSKVADAVIVAVTMFKQG